VSFRSTTGYILASLRDGMGSGPAGRDRDPRRGNTDHFGMHRSLSRTVAVLATAKKWGVAFVILPMQGATRIHGDMHRTPTKAAHVRWLSWLGCFAAATAAATALGAAAGAGDKVIPPEPALPALKSIRLEPASLLLEDARDATRGRAMGRRRARTASSSR